MREIIIKGTIQLRLVDESVDLGNSEFSQWRPRGAAEGFSSKTGSIHF